MTILFAVDEAGEDMLKAIRVLDGIAGFGKIRVRPLGVEISTESEDLALIISQMLMAGPVAATPAVIETPEKSLEGTAGAKVCEVCGTWFLPTRAKQLLCGNPACRAVKQKEYVAKSDAKKKARKLAGAVQAQVDAQEEPGEDLDQLMDEEAGQATEAPFDQALPNSLERIGRM